jgi:hypothetical protein
MPRHAPARYARWTHDGNGAITFHNVENTGMSVTVEPDGEGHATSVRFEGARVTPPLVTRTKWRDLITEANNILRLLATGPYGPVETEEGPGMLPVAPERLGEYVDIQTRTQADVPPPRPRAGSPEYPAWLQAVAAAWHEGGNGAVAERWSQDGNPLPERTAARWVAEARTAGLLGGAE